MIRFFKERGVFLLIGIFCFSFLSCEGFNEQIMYNNAGRLHDSKKFKEAIAIYKKLLKGDPKDEKHPENAIVMYDLAAAYIDTGERAKALSLVKKLEKMKRKDLGDQVRRLLHADKMMNK